MKAISKLDQDHSMDTSMAIPIFVGSGSALEVAHAEKYLRTKDGAWCSVTSTAFHIIWHRGSQLWLRTSEILKPLQDLKQDWEAYGKLLPVHVEHIWQALFAVSKSMAKQIITEFEAGRGREKAGPATCCCGSARWIGTKRCMPGAPSNWWTDDESSNNDADPWFTKGGLWPNQFALKWI